MGGVGVTRSSAGSTVVRMWISTSDKESKRRESGVSD
jgi:hypothetical protein